MNLRLVVACSLAATVFGGVADQASAWFIWIPTGAIARALETDPDTIEVTLIDRSIGKCAGYHVNQYKKHMPARPGASDEPGAFPVSPETPVAAFHKEIADLAVAKAADKQKVIELADAYSTRWSRVAGADLNANRAYGADLAQGCVANSLPHNETQYAAWKGHQEDEKRRQEEIRARVAEEERIRTVEAKRKAQEDQELSRRLRDEQDGRRSPPVALPRGTAQQPQVDFAAEARKSARILGCNARELTVMGADGNNVLFTAACDSGDQLALTCEPSGICLKR